MRTIIDLPKEQLDSLKAHCEANDISRAEAIRRAVDVYLSTVDEDDHQAFGLLKGTLNDGLEYQNKLRDEWS